MQQFKRVWNSTIVQKWVMAITGIGLVAFLIGHLSGNLLVFLGPDHMNRYGVELREMFHGVALWIIRAGLLMFFVLHVNAGIRLSIHNRRAKGQGYERNAHKASTVASRSMAYTGVLILVYLLYHLAHFTLGTVHGEFFAYTDALGRHDIYRMVVESFQQPVIVIIYAVAMIVTGLHLNHAISSAFQTLGINHPKYTPIINAIGPALALLLVAGFLSVPFAVITGIVQ